MKKKILAILLVACMLGVSTLAFGVTAVGAQTLDDADRCFLEYMSADSDDSLTYTRKPLYNEELRQSGWQYDFTLGGKSGYALLTRITLGATSVYEVEEADFDGASPFDACRGVPVYITHKTYIDYRDGAFYNLATGAAVGDDQIAEYVYYGFRYTGGAAFYDISETIYYVSKATTEEYSIPFGLPTYAGYMGSSNCANVAGSIAVGYYDRFCTELIPNYETYTMLGGVFVVYEKGGTEIANVQSRLKVLMQTDIGGAGTTFTGFQSGMNAFASERGYSYTSENMFAAGVFNLDKVKTAVKAGKPVAIFLSKFAVASVSYNGSADIVYNICSNVPHVVTCCGYRVDTYYDASGRAVSAQKYLKVAIGLEGTLSGICWLNINGLSTIEQAVSMNIS